MTDKPDVLLPGSFEHPEGLVWDHRHQRLLWVDLFKGHILEYDPHTGSLRCVSVGQSVGCVAPRASGGWVCGVREGFGFVSEAGVLSTVATPGHDSSRLRMNDGGVDSRGRFWAGTMAAEPLPPSDCGALFRLDPSGAVTPHLGEVAISNGIGWSPDSTVCYYVDSATHRIDQFDFVLDDGRLGSRRTLAEVAEYPDGLAVDVDGCIWVAVFGGSEVRRFTPHGRIDRVIRLPGDQVTTCTFGGPQLRTLFIAVSAYGLSKEASSTQGAGFIYAVDAGVQGLPSNEFAG